MPRVCRRLMAVAARFENIRRSGGTSCGSSAPPSRRSCGGTVPNRRQRYGRHVSEIGNPVTPEDDEAEAAEAAEGGTAATEDNPDVDEE